MKFNLALLFTIILVLGIISGSYEKKVSSRRISKRGDEGNKTAAAPAAAGGKKKSLQNLKAIIGQIGGSQQSSTTDVNDIKLFLDQQINADSAKSPSDLDHQQECQFRQGYLTEIVKSEKINGKTVAQGRHVFAVLNKRSISIFEAVNVNALIASLELTDINDPVVSIQKINCFTLQNKNNKERSLQLCAKNQTEMEVWMHDIKNMLTCKVVQKPVVKEEPKFESSEETANSELKMKISSKKHELEQKELNKEEQEKLEAQRAADYQRIQQEKDEQQKKIIEDQMKKAIEELQRKRQLQEKQKRIEEYKRKRQEALNKKAQEKLRCLEKKLKGQEYDARKQVEIQIKDQVSQEIQQDLNKTVSSISEAEQKGLEKIMQEEKSLTDEKVEQSNKYQDILVQQVMEYEKILNPGQCYANENKNGNNIKNICPTFIQPGQRVDLEQLKQCLDKDKFCGICCNNNLGKAKQVEISQCVDKCEKTVNKSKYLQNKSKTGVLSKDEQQELLELTGRGFLVTVAKGDRIAGWKN